MIYAYTHLRNSHLLSKAEVAVDIQRRTRRRIRRRKICGSIGHRPLRAAAQKPEKPRKESNDQRYSTSFSWCRFPSPTCGDSSFLSESDDLLDERNLNEDDEDNEMESAQKRQRYKNFRECFDTPCSTEGETCCNTNAGKFTCVSGLCKLTHPNRGWIPAVKSVTKFIPMIIS